MQEETGLTRDDEMPSTPIRRAFSVELKSSFDSRGFCWSQLDFGMAGSRDQPQQ